MPSLPTTQTLEHFRAFLFEAKLSKVSVKNYVSDIRKFLEWANKNLPLGTPPYPSPGNITSFIANLQLLGVPQSTINRHLASLRRFTLFLNIKYQINIEQPVVRRSISASTQTQTEPESPSPLITEFVKSLQNEELSHSTIKNYKSDLNHFIYWSAKNRGLNEEKLTEILSETNLNLYQDYLKVDQTSSSVFNRRVSTLKKFSKFAYNNNLILSDPFTITPSVPSIRPLAFFKRLVKRPPTTTEKDRPRNKFLFHLTNHPLYLRYHSLPFTPYLHLALLVLFTALLASFGYDQIIKQALPGQAFPSSPVRPTRQLSFQGRLTDSSDTPITTPTNVTFKLYNTDSEGSELYTSGTCTVSPDQDGIFNTLIGDGNCGAEITNNVFSENQNVYLEIAIGDNILSPRQQIATVGYALNSETLQGYPINATGSATRSTVAVMNQWGEVILGEQSPVLKSVSGNFGIQGETLTLSTATTTNGNINLVPDGSGSINAIGGVSSGDFLRITDANLTSGNLISGYVGNNTSTGNFIDLSSWNGSSETTRFAIATTGQTTIDAIAKGQAALIVNQLDSGPIFTASASGSTQFLIENSGNIQASGNISGLTGINSSGTITFSGLNTAGAVVYTNSSGDLGVTAQGTSGQCLISGGSSVPTWVDCASVSGGNTFWNQNNGLLFPKNSTVDVTIGGQSTASSKFAFINVDSGTPTATISGSSGRAISIDANGNIVTTANQSLTLGAAGTGNIILAPGGTTALTAAGANLTTPGTFTLPNSNTLTGVSGFTQFSNGISVGGATTFSLSSTGDLNANSVSIGGTSVITSGRAAQNLTGITSSGTITFSGLNTAGAIVYTNGSGVLNVTAQGTTGQLLTSGGSGTPTWTNSADVGTNYWNQTNGTLQPKNATVDLLVGGTATTSSKFAFINVDSGTPTATISGSSGRALSLDAFGNITTTVNQQLTLGAAGTGNILISPGGTPALLAIGANLSAFGTLTLPNSNTLTGVANFTQFSNGVSVGGGTTFYFNTSGDINANSLSIGGTSVISSARAAQNLTGITSSGTITFSGLNTAGAVVYTNGSGTLGVTAQGTTGQCLTSGGTGTPVWLDCGSASAGNIYWNQNNGLLFPKNSTVDMTIGGQSTASAKFAFYNVDSGTPTATISGSSNRALSLDAFGNITTTNSQTLTIGSSSTGNITLSPQGGAVGANVAPSTDNQVDLGTASLRFRNIYGTINPGFTTGSVVFTGSSGELAQDNANFFWNDTTNRLSIGGTTATTTLDVTGSASLSGTIAFRGTTDPKIDILNGENFGIRTSVGGDAGLSEKLTILNGGNVGISDTTPDAALNILSTTEQLRLDYDDSNFASFTVSSAGGLTVTPVGILNLNSTGDLTLDSSTDINLDADGSDILLKDGGTTFATFTNSSTNLSLNVVGGSFLFADGDVLNVGGAAATAYNFFANSTTGVAAVDGDADLYIQDELEVDGTTTFNNLTYTWPSTQSLNYVLSTNGTGTLSWADPTALAGASVYWNQTNGLLYPKNSTVDVTIGGQSTASAKFAFYNVDSGTPTATISGSSARALSLDAFGNITTTSNQSLVLGSSTTGNIILAPTGKNVGIGDTTPDYLFEIYDTTNTPVVALSDDDITHGLTTLAETDTFFHLSSLSTTTGGSQITSISDTDAQALLIRGVIGTTNPTDTISAIKIIGAKGDGSNGIADLGALETVFQVANNDDTAALTILGSGYIGINRVNPSTNLDIDGSATISATLSLGPLDQGRAGSCGAATAGKIYYDGAAASYYYCNGSIWTQVGSGAGSSFWGQQDGLLYPLNSTVDVTIGGQSTASAKFAFKNVDSGTPTASISGSSNRALVLDAFGNINTTAMQSLLLGNSATGNVIINPGGNVAIGAAVPTAGYKLDVTGNATISADLRIGGQFQFGRYESNPTNSVGKGAVIYNTSTDTLYYSNGTSWFQLAVGAGGNIWTDGGSFVYPTNRESARIYDSGGTDYVDLAHDGTNAVFTSANTTKYTFDQTVDITGGLITSGNLDVNGTSNDIAGTLNLSGNTLTAPGNLLISSTGGTKVTIQPDLQVNGGDILGSSGETRITLVDLLQITNVTGLLSADRGATFSAGIAADTPLTLKDNSLNTIFTVANSGNITTSTGNVTSTVANGASAVAYTLNTSSTYSTYGAKLLSVQNNGSEKMYLDKDGNLYVSGSVISNNGFTQLFANKSGGSVVNRSLVVLDSSNNSAFTTTTTPNDVDAYGVVIGVGLGVTNDADSDGVCDANDNCFIAMAGEVEVLLENASSASRGQYIFTSDTAGQGYASGQQYDGLIGVVSNTSGAGSGYVKMIFKIQPQVTATATLDKGSKHNEYRILAEDYTPVGDGSSPNDNIPPRGLFFDNLTDPTKSDFTNTTAGGPVQISKAIGNPTPASPFRAGLMGGQTMSTSTTDNAGNTYLGSNVVNDTYYYDRTRDSAPRVLVELGIDPNWYNGVTLNVATSSSQFSQNGVVPGQPNNPNLSPTYNGSLLKVTGNYASNARPIYITIKTPSTFDWTDYMGQSATGVTITPGSSQTLGTSGVSVTFSNARYNVGDVFKILSWFVEPSSSTRGSRQQFPERSYIIGSNDAVDIIDADTQKLWMRFSTGTGTYLTGSVSGRTPVSVDMLNGALYIAETGSTSGLLPTVYFAKDVNIAYTTTGFSRHHSPIAGRNSSAGYGSLISSSMATISSQNRSVDAAVIPNQPTQEMTVTGWGSIICDSDCTTSETVNLPYKFNGTPEVILSIAGGGTTSSVQPASLADCTRFGGANNVGWMTGKTYNVTQNTFTVQFNGPDGTENWTNFYLCYTWTATGFVSPRQYAAVAQGVLGSDGAVTILNETDASSSNILIGSQHANILWSNKVALTEKGTLYVAQNDDSANASAVYVYYPAASVPTETSWAQYLSGAYFMGAVASSWTSGGISINGSLATGKISGLEVTQGTSTVDGTSNTIYVAGDVGLTAIQERQGGSYSTQDSYLERTGSIKQYKTGAITEEMVGDIRGMWALNGSGSIANGASVGDSSVKTNTLTVVNTNGTGMSYSTGIRGTAITFDGVDDAALRSGADTDFNFISGESKTMGAWVKTSSDAKYILYSQGSGNGLFALTVGNAAGGTANKANVLFRDDAGNASLGAVSSNTNINDNQWHHIVVSVETTTLRTIRLYVDGVLEDSDTVSGTGVVTVSNSTSFAVNTGSTGIAGQIDEPFTTSVVISSLKIRQMYEVGYRALQGHATTLGGLAADGNQKLAGAAANPLQITNAIAVDYNNQYLYVSSSEAGNGQNNGGVSKIDLISDTNVFTYTSSSTPAVLDSKVTSLSVGYNLETMASTASGALTFSPEDDFNDTSGDFISETLTTVENFTQTYLWTQYVTDSSDTSNTVTVSVSNDNGSTYNQCNLTNTDTNQSPPEYEYFCQLNTPGNQLKVKHSFARGSTKTNTYLTRYGIAWIDINAVANSAGGSGLYTGNNSGVTNGSYIEVAHNQGTNDIVAQGWYFDTATGTWRDVATATESGVISSSSSLLPYGGSLTVTHNQGTLDVLATGWEYSTPSATYVQINEPLGTNANPTDVDLVGFWKLNESSGDLTDSSSFGNTLIDKGSPTYAQQGKVDAGNAISFNGSNAYFCTGSGTTCADDNDFDFAGDYTQSVWLKQTNMTGTQGIMAKGAATRIFTTSQILNVDGNGGSGCAVNTDLADGKWHHVAYANNNGTGYSTLYLDGERMTSCAGGAPTANANDFEIGALSAGSFFNGTIDEVAVWKRQLSAEEIKNIYQYGFRRYEIKNTDLNTSTLKNLSETNQNVRLDVATQAYRIQQVNQNTVRLYNYSGATKNLKLDVLTGAGGGGGGCNNGCVSLAPITADVDSQSDTNSIWINKTAESGRLIRLQNDGSDRFTVGWDGHATISGSLTIGQASLRLADYGTYSLIQSSSGSLRLQAGGTGTGASGTANIMFLNSSGNTSGRFETTESTDFDGDGADSTATITAAKNINTEVIGALRSTYADGIAYRVIAPTDGALSVTRHSSNDTISNGIAAGDELLLINLQGTSSDNADVGNFEFVQVASVTSSVITFSSPITKSYDGSTASNQKVVVQRVPNYTNVTISSSGSLTASSWEGLTTTPTGAAGYLTGIVAFRANGTVSVATGTSITTAGKGYRSGAGGTAGGGSHGFQGESYGGTGTQTTAANLGGGGAGMANVAGNRTGAGGGYASSGGNGSTSTNAGVGGGTYGVATLTKLFLGSGGGGGAHSGSGGNGGAGGNGGGIIFVSANTVTVTSTGTITSAGAAGTAATSGDDRSGGGGSGGSTVVRGGTLTLGTTLVLASAGAAGSANAGAGGDGRVRVEYSTSVSGTTSPTASSQQVGAYGTFYAGAVNTSSADLAEYYVAGDKTIEAGDVVSFSDTKVLDEGGHEIVNQGVLRKTEKAYDKKLAGIISTQPGLVLGSIDGDTGRGDKRQLALSGRVPVKIDPDSEAINIGDFLTSSDKPGLAKKATKYGYTVAKALEKWDSQNPTSTIESFVTLDIYDPVIEIASTGDLNIATNSAIFATDSATPQPKYVLKDLADNLIDRVGIFSDAAVANMKAGLVVANEITGKTVTVEDLLISPIADIDLLRVNNLVANNATVSGTLMAERLISPTLDDINGQLSLVTSQFASASSILANIQAKYSSFGAINAATSSADPLDTTNIYQENAFIDNLTVNGAILANSINSNSDTLYLQPLASSPINLLAGLMILTPDGKVTINGDLAVTGSVLASQITTGKTNVDELAGNTATISGSLTAGRISLTDLIIASPATESGQASSSGTINSNATVGIATLPAGSNELYIPNNRVTESTLIYLTPISDTHNQVLFVKNKEVGQGFTIAIPASNSSEIKFNYWLIRSE